MPKRDVLDERMAQRFAWRAVKQGEIADLSDMGEPAAARASGPAEGLRANEEQELSS